MLITTVAIVRVSHAGMNAACMFLWKREGPHVRIAKPNMMMVINPSLRDEDLPIGAATC
ncbi:MAG: hypothetical protein OK455_00670 [Thaumarchaeota archaeon]|nr:hypothetical protein [Nitrososphaerota archaeon]